jgi:transcriptional regulator with PAS, ATPase and Fis domain
MKDTATHSVHDKGTGAAREDGMSHRRSGIGVLVTDRQGVVLHVSDLMENPRVREAALAWQPSQPADMNVVEVDGQRLILMYRAGHDTAVRFAHQAGVEDALFDFVASVDFAYAIFEHLLSSPYEAMTVVDERGCVRYISPVHARFFGLAPGEGFGRHVTEIIENTRLHEVVQTGKAEIGQVQNMRGVARVVSRIPIVSGSKTVGAIGQVMFKAPEAVHDLSREVTRLRSEVAFYRRELSDMRLRGSVVDQIVGTSGAVRKLKADIERVAPLDVPVLLIGESGTGKELAATAIHALSTRHGKPMVTVNAAALPSGLVESELFGYEPGAFSGADRKGRRGRFEMAHRSTLFLDEIGDMPIEVQVKLLRVLQDGQFERVGGSTSTQSSFRLISATHCDLEQLVGTGRFRLDLFYRISTVVLRLPPLRERLEDIPLLARHFLQAFAQRNERVAKDLSPEACAVLRTLPWPGNIRQLQHDLEQAAIFSEGNVIGAEDLPRSAPIHAATVSQVRETLEDVELKMIEDALIRCDGNKKQAASELGISRSHLYKRLARR